MGEWWIEIKKEPNGGQVGLPIYVGMKTPDLSLLELPGRAVASEQGAMAEAEVLLQQIRDDFGLGPLLEDGTLSALAQRPLEEQMAGHWDAVAGVEQCMRPALSRKPPHRCHARLKRWRVVCLIFCNRKAQGGPSSAGTGDFSVVAPTYIRRC